MLSGYQYIIYILILFLESPSLSLISSFVELISNLTEEHSRTEVGIEKVSLKWAIEVTAQI